tara:strand:+ start:12989 stop:13489 length:501 start_codon:yes stop_codon:yes gene_type:complete
MKQTEEIRILKTETCNTLSASAKITYNIGCTPDSKIYFRITNNTGGGFYSNEWVAWDAIQQTLKQCPKDVPITSLFLYPLFKGKSVNTPSFLLAALKHLKLVQPLKDKKRNHELLDFKPFNDEMKAMTSSKVAMNVAKKRTAVKKAAKKTVTKETPATRKKKTTKK